MLETLPTLLSPLMVVVVASFLIYRFGFFSGREVSGRFAFVSGSLLLLMATGYEIVELIPDYSDWFVAGAYSAIDLAQFGVGVLGVLLVVIGLALYADYWQVRREEVDERFSKLSILENLQHDARQPYHLLELLNISLREVLVHYPMSAGAVFLVNRTRRQFVLTGSSGLRKDEIALLEYYPLERNIVSQAVDLGDPMLASRFDFIENSGQRVSSRFRSVLILPLASGMEKIGCLVLFSEESEFFGREDIRYLSPVAQWLAEKIRSARLARELGQVTGQRDEYAESVNSLVSRMSTSARAGASAKTVDGFCQALVGLAGSESVHLCAVNHGSLAFTGGSEPLFDLSENFQAALVDGMARSRPLIINQESTGADGSSGIVQSNLIYPLTDTSGGATLLFIRAGRPFEIEDATLRTIESFAHLANLILQIETQQRSRLTRRKGFDAVLSLLAADVTSDGDMGDLDQFADTLHSALPRNSLCLMLTPGPDGMYIPAHSAGQCSREDAEGLQMPADEGGLGSVVATGESVFIYGRTQVDKHLDIYHDQTRSILRRIFGEAGSPDLLAYCAVPSNDRELTVVLVALYGLSDSDRGEWERLITLAAGLYGVRRTLLEITQTASTQQSETTGFRTPTGLLNQLNNHLSAVIGLAELAERNEGVGETTRAQLRQILQRAEQAADLAQQSLVPLPPKTDAAETDQFNKLVETELDGLHVSGDLYMVGQRPREVRLRLDPVGALDFPSKTLRDLFQSVLNRFGAMVDETDVMTIATYVRDNYAFLDISRHRPNFPPVDEVAGFGRYGLSSEAFRNRPADIYLRHLGDTTSFYAVDTADPVPAFLSFKFPLTPPEEAVSQVVRRSPARLLAIDDQAVILDLISAMGRSLGYEVRTASTGEAGQRLADRIEFDLVLTDLALPDISGFEVAQYIHGRHPNLPIVMVTGWSTRMTPEEQRAAGILEILYKPFRIEQLTALVQKVVNRTTSV